jgi:hypothetical protein
MEKKIPGLHKDMASIVDGIQVPQDHGGSIHADRPDATPRDPALRSQPQEARSAQGASQQPTYSPSSFERVPPKTKSLSSLPMQTKQSSQSGWFKRFIPDDTRQRKMVALVAMLAPVFVFIIFKTLVPAAQRTPQAVSAAVALDENLLAKARHVTKINWRIPDLIGQLPRDPMSYTPGKPCPDSVLEVFSDAQEKTPKLLLKGIAHSEDDAVAIINKEIVHKGDRVDGVTVIDIQANYIELEYQGHKWTQTLDGSP